MRNKIRSHFKIIGLILLFVVFYNEYLIYYIQTFKWQTLKCSKPEECVKVLLVADPQILGDPSEGQLLLKFFNWDCDRFLANTYYQAVKHANPDVVLFLGDLTNDGSIATREEFYGYVKRVAHIFNTQYPIKHVWIPGDNDIGGENGPIKPEKVKMFNAAFKQPDYISVKFVDIYKTNLLMQYTPGLTNIVPNNRTKLAISHMPLLLTPGRFTLNALTKIQPSAIFSGHNHDALRLTLTLDSNFVTKIDNLHPKDSEQIITINLKQEEFTEFVVPTSSYRMNVFNVGYAVAYIDGYSQKLHYSVLWSPQRFYPLKIYVITISSTLTYILLTMLYKALAVTRAFRLNYSSFSHRP